MAEDVFPRLVYRGHPDTLGLGTHSHPDTGDLVGETLRVEDQDHLDRATADGWRLTREIADDPSDDDASTDDTSEDPAPDAPRRKKKK